MCIRDRCSGIIQGSGIGPIMFLSYINELIAILETYGIVVRAFDDDVKMYVWIVHGVNLLQVQYALNALLKWADEWQLTVSVEKCCVLNIGQIVLMPHLMMHNEVLRNVTEVRDLGIKVTNYLPSDHVQYVTLLLRPTNMPHLSIDVLSLVILICLFELTKYTSGCY